MQAVPGLNGAATVFYDANGKVYSVYTPKDLAVCGWEFGSPGKGVPGTVIKKVSFNPSDATQLQPAFLQQNLSTLFPDLNLTQPSSQQAMAGVVTALNLSGGNAQAYRGDNGELIISGNGRQTVVDLNTGKWISSVAKSDGTLYFQDSDNQAISVKIPEGHDPEVTKGRTTDSQLTPPDTTASSGAQNLSHALAATASFLSLVQAIQSGKPLPIAGAGINMLATVNPTNTVLSGASSAVGAVASLINLQKNIQKGDALGSLVAGANLVSYSASAYASALGYTATQQASALTQAAGASEFGAASGAVGTVGQAVPYINLVYSLTQGNYVGAAVAVLSMIPVYGQIIAAAYAVYSMIASDEDVPGATGGYKWNDDGSVGIDIRWTAGGGDRILAARLNGYLDTLKAIMNQAQAQNPAAKLGLIANRLPGLIYDLNNAVLTDIDPVTGKDRSIRYNSEGRPVNAVAGSPEFFRTLNEQFIYSALGREAIAPQWEVDTARLQTQAHDPQAGLTELQRAQRNDQLASAPDKNATAQTWRPIMLDFNGDGVQVVGKSAGNVEKFLNDGNEFLSDGSVVDAVNEDTYQRAA